MSDSLQDLERQYNADPRDIQIAQALMNARVRANWKHEGKTIEEWDLELQSKSKFRIISACCELSELGLLAMNCWPKIVQALSAPSDKYSNDSWNAFSEPDMTSVVHRVGTFLGTISLRIPDRVETLWRWLSEEAEEEYPRTNWSHSRGTAAIIALGHLAKEDSALIPSLLDHFLRITPRNTPFNMTFRRIISELLSDDLAASKNISISDFVIKKRASVPWSFEERTVDEWLLELRSGSWTKMRMALDAIQHLGILAHDLWPDIVKSLTTPFGDALFMSQFGDDHQHENFGAFLALIAVGDSARIERLRQWLLHYDHDDASRKTLGIIAIRALSRLAKTHPLLTPILVESFNKASVPNDGSEGNFYQVYFEELAKLLPEAQGARDKLFDFAVNMNNPTTVVHTLGHFYLEPAQFETILNRFIFDDYHCDRREASLLALCIQVKQYPERLDWIIKAIESRSNEASTIPPEFSPLRGDLETLSQIHKTKPAKVLHLLATCFNNAPLGDAKNREFTLRSLKIEFEYFGTQSDYETLYQDKRQTNEIREAAFIGVAILTENRSRVREKLRQVPIELQGHLFEKARLFFKE
ncbi:MAG: hypothetical protein P1V97_00610 [Planctomycetota bacterium]|nr:hypothetical protein [Planctomycetota bacterium]